MDNNINLTTRKSPTSTPISNNITQYLIPPTAASRASPSSATTTPKMNTSIPTAASLATSTLSSTAAATRATLFSTTTTVNTSTPAATTSAKSVTTSSAAYTFARSTPSSTAAAMNTTPSAGTRSTPLSTTPKTNTSAPATATPFATSTLSSTAAAAMNNSKTPSAANSHDNERLELRRDATAAQKSDSRTTTSLMNDTPITERSESVKSNDGADSHETASSRPSASTRVARPCLPPLDTSNVQQLQHVTTAAPVLIADTYIRERPDIGNGNSTGRADNNEKVSSSRPSAASTSSRIPRTRTPAPSSRDIERRKLQPDQYKFGVTKNNTQDGRIIVPLENDPNLVHEYSHSNNNYWYCRFCAAISKERARVYAIMRGDKSFDALIHHICPPVTAEQSEKEQERIKAKYSRKRTAQGASVVPVGDNPSSSSTETPRARGSQGVTRGPDNNEVDNLQDGFNQEGGTSNGNPTLNSHDIERRIVQGPSVVPVGGGHELEKEATPRTTRSRPVNYHEGDDSFEDNFNQSVGTSNDEVSGNGRRNNNCTPAPSSRDIERRKLQPDQYKFGVTKNNTQDGRIIVPLENDPNLVHEYTKRGNRWYCRLCSTVTKDKNRIYTFMNDDGTFDAIVHHICKPLTAEESQKEQERIKTKNSRNRNDQEGSVVPTGDNASSSSAETSRPRRSQAGTDNHEVGKLQDGLNQSSGTPRKVLIPGRRSRNSASMREVPRSQWEFGFNRAGQKDKRIIVFESNDRQHVREYGIYDGHIHCLGCYNINKSYNLARLDSEKELLFVLSSHVCTTRSYSEIEKEQKLYASKCNKKDGDEQNESTEEGSSSKRPRMDDSESMRQEFKASANAANPADADNGINLNDDFDQPPSPPSTANSQQPPAAALPVITSSSPLNVQSVSPLPDLLPIRFYSPSGFFLNHCCDNIGITYNREVNTFWANINGDNFNLNSIPQNVHQILNEEMSGFSALSLLLTGSESSAITIKCNLNTYILQNCDAIGELVRQDLTRCNNPKLLETISAKNPTEIHFVAMTRLFNCRFAIFKDGGCKCYGNWNPAPEYIPIFLLEFKNDKYSPIISF